MKMILIAGIFTRQVIFDYNFYENQATLLVIIVIDSLQILSHAYNFEYRLVSNS